MSQAGGDSYSSYVGSTVTTNDYGAITPCVSGLTIIGSPENGPIYGGTAGSCGVVATLGTQGLMANRYYAMDEQASNQSQQGGGYVVGLQPPQGCSLTAHTSGGSLADGTYTYIFTALNGLSTAGSVPYESWWSQAVTVTLTGGGGSGYVSGSCTASTGAVSYRMYGRVSLNAPDSFTGYIAGSSFPLSDTGSLTAGSLPVTYQPNGNAALWSVTEAGGVKDLGLKEDFSQSSALLIPNFASDPATCTASALEFNTTSAAPKYCSVTNTWTAFGSGGSGPTIQTNTFSNTNQSLLNFLTSTANTVGLTVTPSNPSGGVEKMEVTGAYSGALCSMTTLGDTCYQGASVPTRLAGPTGPNGVPQVLTDIPSSGAAVAEAWAPGGVVPDPQTGTTYTIAATDRLSYVTFSNASAIAVTLPQAGTTGFTSNFAFIACDIGAGTATITPTTSTISFSTGSAYTSAASSMALTTGQCGWFYSDNTNYFVVRR